MSKMRNKNIFAFVKKEIDLMKFAGILSLIYLLVLHIPFFIYVFDHMDMGFWHQVYLTASLAVFIFAANFMVIYLLIYFLRKVGQFLVGLLVGTSAAAVYFSLTYNVIFDDGIMASVWNTQVSEASGFFNVGMVVAILFCAVLPWILIAVQRVRRGTLKRAASVAGISVGVILLVIAGNLKNTLWIGQHDTELGGLVMPWSYIVNTVRAEQNLNREEQPEIILPDAQITDNEKAAFVLVIGESARRANFSLYGYERQTNPLLGQQERLRCYLCDACDTYTMACTKCILEYKPAKELYEILPNYLYRNGVDVYWRTSNWGNPPVRVAHYAKKETLRETSTAADKMFDGVLVDGLADVIASSDSSKVLVVLHTSTSHGPKYTEKYPKEYEVFTPVSDKVEASARSHEALINAYDNSIRYTDHLLNAVIEQLKTLDGWHTTMLYLSDHGESLGENNVFMHGVPVNIAPREQIEIPFLLWTSDDWREVKPLEEATQHHVFHTVLDYLSVDSPVYDPDMDLFEKRQ